jgi:hypothetical protein
VAIGDGAGTSSQGTHSIAIGHLAGYVSQHRRTIILNADGTQRNSDGEGRFYVIPVRGSVNTGNTVYYNTSTGEITYASSSIRFKKNVQDLSPATTQGVYHLRPRTFDGKFEAGHFVGFIAEEVADVDPDLAVLNPDTRQPDGINWNTITTYTVAELQRLRETVDALQAEVAALKGQSARTVQRAQISELLRGHRAT